MDDDGDFEHQLQQEADERHRQDASSDAGNAVDSNATRVDEDGTVFEFDMEKRAWFPKIDDDFIAKYQMNYGTDSAAATTESTTKTNTENTAESTTTVKAATDYATYYQQYYGTQPADAKAYWDYYNKYCNEYYKSQQTGKTGPTGTGSNIQGTAQDATKQTEQSEMDTKEATSNDKVSSTGDHPQKDGKTSDEGTTQEVKDPVMTDGAQPEYDYAAYYHYYYSHYDTPGDNNKEGAGEKDGKEKGTNPAKPIVFEPTGNKEYDDYWSAYFSQQYIIPEEEEEDEGKKEEGKETEKDAEGEAGKKGKKGKRKEPEAGWFDVDTEKLTSVYVSGMPVDITDEEFKELMNKCGLVMYDVRTRKPKLKLYKDSTGTNKGDGLCCYIKPESVELALQILDGYELRGQRMSVEVAQFELKGQYDPSKKKKKLSNREKKRMKKQQEKLFNWHLEKDVPIRQKKERIVIVKNLFDPNVFEGNPVLINKIRDDLRNECSKHGDVRKVIIYDRHQDGVASVIFKLAEEADTCTAAMNNRMWGKRVITAESWDGNTKYEVEETEAEREKRINEWENFLEGKDGMTQEKKDGGTKSDSKNNDLTKLKGVGKGHEEEKCGVSAEMERGVAGEVDGKDSGCGKDAVSNNVKGRTEREGGEDKGEGSEDKGEGGEDKGEGSEDKGEGSEDKGEGGEDKGEGSEDKGEGSEDKGEGSEDKGEGGEDKGEGGKHKEESGEDRRQVSEDEGEGKEEMGKGEEEEEIQQEVGTDVGSENKVASKDEQATGETDMETDRHEQSQEGSTV